MIKYLDHCKIFFLNHNERRMRKHLPCSDRSIRVHLEALTDPQVTCRPQTRTRIRLPEFRNGFQKRTRKSKPIRTLRSISRGRTLRPARAVAAPAALTTAKTNEARCQFWVNELSRIWQPILRANKVAFTLVRFTGSCIFAYPKFNCLRRERCCLTATFTHSNVSWNYNPYHENTYLGKNDVGTVWPDKNRQMSIKVAQKWFQ